MKVQNLYINSYTFFVRQLSLKMPYERKEVESQLESLPYWAIRAQTAVIFPFQR